MLTTFCVQIPVPKHSWEGTKDEEFKTRADSSRTKRTKSLAHLEKIIEFQGKSVNRSLHHDYKEENNMMTFMMLFQRVASGVCFWEQQFEAASCRDPQSMRWYPMISCGAWTWKHFWVLPTMLWECLNELDELLAGGHLSLTTIGSTSCSEKRMKKNSYVEIEWHQKEEVKGRLK